MIALIDPFTDSGLSSLFADFGLKLQHRLVLDDQSHYSTDPATPAVSSYPRHKITRNLPLTFFPGAASLVPLRTASSGEVRLTPLVQTTDTARNEPIPPDTGKPDVGLQTLVVLATKKLGAADQRAELVLIGDVDFATNSFFHVLGNGALFLNAMSYLADQQRLIDITPRQYEMPRVQLTNTQMRATFLLSAVLLLVGALALSVFVWWRRQRRARGPFARSGRGSPCSPSRWPLSCGR